MKLIRIHFYLLFFLALIINGCDCYDDESQEELPCENLDENKLKTFTFDIYATYRKNNQPIQSESHVVVYIEFYNYELFMYYSDAERCSYDYRREKFTKKKYFNESGHAIITTDKFEFDNKYDGIKFIIWINVPGSTDFDKSFNHKIIVAKYNSEEEYTLNFSYLSENDL